MPIYYLKFKIIPTINNDHFDIVSGAFASCWVECEDPFSAINISKFHVIKSEWVIEEIGTQPIICTIEDFNDRDIGKIYFTKAEEEGLSICYTAWARDGKTSKSLEVPTKKINICEYLSLQKKLAKKADACITDLAVSVTSSLMLTQYKEINLSQKLLLKVKSTWFLRAIVI